MLCLLSTVAIAKEQTILTTDLENGGIKVKGYIVETGVPACKNPMYDYNDRDSNGVFDRVCVGLKYDPCDKENSIAKAYFERQQQGLVCQDRPKCGDLTISPNIGCRP